MSANNWDICPQCVKNLEDEIAHLQARVQNAYGTVDRDQYDRLVAEVKSKENNKITDCTLREDYELGIAENSVFEVSYGASCTVCGYSFTYRYQEIVPLKQYAA